MNSHLFFCAVGCATCFLFGSATTGMVTQASRLNDSEEPLKTLMKGHPRLIILNEQIEKVRKLLSENPEAKKFYKRIKAQAERI